MEILEVEKELAEYKLYQQKEKIKADDKKKRYMQMMVNNLESQNQRVLKESQEEMAKSHLINTKEIIMMD